MAGWIGAAVSAAEGLINTFGGSALSYHYNKKLMNHQFDLQKAMLDYTNEYNLPKNQVARLIQGGINPNLAVSSANSVSGSSTPNISGGSVNVPPLRLNLLEGMKMREDIRAAAANADWLEQKAEGQALENQQRRDESPFWRVNAEVKSDTLKWLRQTRENEAKDSSINHLLNEMIMRSKLGLDADVVGTDGSPLEGEYFRLSDTPLASYVVNSMLSKGISNDKAEKAIKLMDKQMDEITQRIDLMKKQGRNIDMRTTLLGFEKDMKETLGVSFNDNLGFRLLAILLRGLGISVRDLGKVMSEEDLPEGAGYSGVSQH